MSYLDRAVTLCRQAGFREDHRFLRGDTKFASNPASWIAGIDAGDIRFLSSDTRHTIHREGEEPTSFPAEAYSHF